MMSMVAAVTGSMLVVLSSRRTITGRLNRTRARPSCWRCPCKTRRGPSFTEDRKSESRHNVKATTVMGQFAGPCWAHFNGASDSRQGPPSIASRGFFYPAWQYRYSSALA